MDTSTVLAWFFGIGSLLSVVRVARDGRAILRGWLGVHVGILALLGLTAWLDPQRCGWWIAGAWTVLVALPAVGVAFVNGALQKAAFGPARNVARMLAILHPLDGWTRYPEYVRLQRATHEGDPDATERSLRRLVDTPFENLARVTSVAITGDWGGYAAWFEHAARDGSVESDPVALAAYLGALGRTGRRREMLEVYERLAERVGARTRGAHPALLRAAIATQTGRVELVRRLHQGPLSGVPPIVREVQLAESKLVAGQLHEAEEKLRAVVAIAESFPAVVRPAQRLLERPTPVLEGELEDDAERIARAIERELDEEQQYAAPTGSARRPLVTYAIVFAIAVGYGVEVGRGDTTDPGMLAELGAVVLPSAPGFDQWWRPISAGFLHFGALHLMLNVAGLVILGRWLESVWPRSLVLACFALSLLASTTLLAPLVTPPDGGVLVFVGASGGVLGLLGALLGRVIVGRVRGGGTVVRRQLGMLLLVVGLQVVFDQAVPEVSSTAHVVGFLFGLAFGLAASLLEPRTNRA